MSELWNKLKTAKPAEMTVDIDEETSLLVIGLQRVEKNDLVSECTSPKGKVNNNLLEGKLLARCVYDPQTRQPLQPDHRQWNIASHITGPCISAAMKCCGFDDDEMERMLKKSEPVEDIDSQAA